MMWITNTRPIPPSHNRGMQPSDEPLPAEGRAVSARPRQDAPPGADGERSFYDPTRPRFLATDDR